MPFKLNERGLFVFVHEDRRPIGKCTVITSCTDDGEVTHCNTPLFTPREYQQHVARCSAEHIDAIRKAGPRTRMPGFHGPEAGIPDVEAWLQKQDTNGVSNREKAIRGEKRL
jgi:hypothetical protein